MAKNIGAGEPGEGAPDATPEEVEAAIKGVSDADALRLGRVGEFYARNLAGLGLGISGDDLLAEAMKRTHQGRRHWKKKKVTFVKHLCEAMRSIASHAPDKLHGAVIVAAAEDTGPGTAVAIATPFPDARRLTSAKEQLAEIRAAFADDEEVGLVIECMADRAKGPEIQADLGITEKQYEAIMLRLRRGLDRKAGWRA